MDEVKDPQKALERRVKRHVTSQEHTFFAVVQPGFEHTAQSELESLGIDCPMEITEGGLEFSCGLDTCYLINAVSRTIIRVIMRIARFKATDFDRFKNKLLSVPWELYITPGIAIETSITSRHSRLYHTGRLEEDLKAALSERLQTHGLAPALTVDHSVQTVYVRFKDDRCTISLDASGEALYKRGYKTYSTTATLRETTASLILHEARFKEYPQIIDPMCGSGTFGIETLSMIHGFLPGKDRSFAFMQWPAFRENNFRYLINKYAEQQRETSGINVFMYDASEDSIKAARLNCLQAGVADFCEPLQHDFFTGDLPGADKNKAALTLINPPYGKRLKHDSIKKLYRKIGETLQNSYPRWGYAVICPGLELEKALSLPYNRKVLFMNGGIRVSVIIKDASGI